MTKRPTFEQMEALEEKLNGLQNRLNFVDTWVRAQLVMHQPYVGGRIDVSISTPENMKAEFIDRLSKNIWCTQCSRPWPCRLIRELRILREAIRRGSDLEHAHKAVKSTMQPIDQPNVIETAL